MLLWYARSETSGEGSHPVLSVDLMEEASEEKSVDGSPTAAASDVNKATGELSLEPVA